MVGERAGAQKLSAQARSTCELGLKSRFSVGGVIKWRKGVQITYICMYYIYRHVTS